MKHIINKISVIFIVTLIGLAGSSAAYAMWWDDLHLDVTISSGDVEWIYTGILYIDQEGDNNDWHCNPGFVGGNFWQGDKHVGWTNAYLVDDHHARVELFNVYPCYFTMISMYMKVVGSIPIHIQSVTYTTDTETITIDTGTPIHELDLDGNGFPDIEIWWKDNWFGDQYHQGDYVEEISFWLHVMQPAPQGAELSFDMTFMAVQYNEYTPPID